MNRIPSSRRNWRDRTSFQDARGFSMIELVAVISIISIMLFLTLPRFDVFSRQDDLKGAARWVTAQVPGLKAKAVSDQKQYLLTVDLDNNAFGIFPEEMSNEESEIPALKNYPLADSIRLKDVVFPEKGVITSGRPGIRFYKKGYSDKAIIHIQDEDNHMISLFIEPFINTVVLSEGYVSFDR